MNNTTTLSLEVQDFTTSELARNEQLRKFMATQKDTLICGGFGERLAVKNKCLVVYRGEQEPIELYPNSHGVKTIIYLLLVGTISLPALRWIQREKIQLLVINEFGETTLMSSEETKNHALRARQYSLPEDEQLAYARYLLKCKIEAQAQTLEKHSTSLDNTAFLAGDMRANAAWYNLPDNLQEQARRQNIPVRKRYMQIEAIAADLYFDAWKSVTIKWTKKDMKRVPLYWREFHARRDYGHKNAHNAHHPINALLNFAYGLLSARLELACKAEGLEVDLGVLHSLKERRASLICDLIEPLRGMIDDIVLSYLEKYTLSLGDFVTEENGMVKLAVHFAKLFAAHVSRAIDNQAIHSVIQEYCNFLLAETASQKVA